MKSSTLFIGILCFVGVLGLELSEASDSVLDSEFCDVYYALSAGEDPSFPACEAVKAAVKSDLNKDSSELLPTLSLGMENISKPALFFIHGYPDNAAEWAAQFATFCYGPFAKYRCIAPTWGNLHPDVPDAPPDELTFDKQLSKLAATARHAGLSNDTDVTLWIHDWGSFLGYQLLWRQPSLFNRTISFDIGSDAPPKLNTTYQVAAAKAFEARDDDASIHNCKTINNGLFGYPPRSESCVSRAGWPYVQAAAGFPTLHPIHTGPPTDKEGKGKPLLFMYGDQTYDGAPRPDDALFFTQRWVDTVNGLGGGSKVVAAPTDHWFGVRAPGFTNGVAMAWLEEERA